MHADDIRTLATSEETLTRRIALVKTFAEENLLKLNTNKCKIVVFSRDRNFAPPSCEVEGSEMPVGDVGKCLGYWWKGDLLATRSVDDNIKKARRTFSQYGREISAPSPQNQCWSAVSSLSYSTDARTGCQKLESLQSELVKRMLK